MTLSDLNLQSEYRSDNCDLVQDFYIPCLENSTLYSRAVGFFSSTSMATVANGLMSLVRAGGKMRLIASPCLSAEDAEAIALGIKQREEVITQNVLRELDQEFEEVIKDRLACLAWLLSKNLLEIKLAVHKNIGSQRGIYHEKLGLFADEAGNLVAFTGSANESSSALIDNFECIDVFCSWEEGVRERTLSKAENFRRLWENQTPLLDVLDFPEAAKRSLLRLRPEQFPVDKIKKRTAVMSEASKEYIPIVMQQDHGVPVLPSNLELREYQKQAIANWFKNSGRGTLKMATGSGKTITALAIATEPYQKIGLQVLLIVCPYRHLVIQWSRECQKFGMEPILAFENVHNWQDRLSTQLYNVRSGYQKFLTIGLADVETATLKLEGFVDGIEKEAADFWEGIDTKQSNINHLKTTISRLELELEAISEQLRKSPVEDIRQMQIRLDEIDRKVEDLNLEKGKKLQKYIDYQVQIENLQKQIKNSRQNEGKQKLAQKRIDAAQQAIDLLIELKTNRNELFRKQLETRIDEIFSQISFKAQTPRLSEKYELSLVETVAGQEVQSGASTGENQILSLSFIGSIIDRVREWSKSGLVMGPDSSTFPIVMDSPFGSLDEIYRRQVARLIPQLANQLVVMVSKTQWRIEVAEEMTPRVGKEYVFVFNSNKPDTQTDDIVLYGKSYLLVRKSAYDYEYTEVLEVNHG